MFIQIQNNNNIMICHYTLHEEKNCSIKQRKQHRLHKSEKRDGRNNDGNDDGDDAVNDDDVDTGTDDI